MPIEPEQYLMQTQQTSSLSKLSSVSKAKFDQLQVKDVTPELVAQIIKHYVLPMFDMKTKGRVLRQGSVYQELKLTEVLIENL